MLTISMLLAKTSHIFSRFKWTNCLLHVLFHENKTHAELLKANKSWIAIDWTLNSRPNSIKIFWFLYFIANGTTHICENCNKMPRKQWIAMCMWKPLFDFWKHAFWPVFGGWNVVLQLIQPNGFNFL